MIIKKTEENNKVKYSVFNEESSDALCSFPTLTTAAAFVRYIGGGNMSDQERDSVITSLNIISEAERKKAAARTNKSKATAASSNKGKSPSLDNCTTGNGENQ